MGAYVNPSGESKEEWLSKNATKLDGPPSKFDEVPGSLPVSLVNNGPFTAAGICFDQGELAEFSAPDRRPKKWFMAKIEDLMSVSNLDRYLKAT